MECPDIVIEEDYSLKPSPAKRPNLGGGIAGGGGGGGGGVAKAAGNHVHNNSTNGIDMESEEEEVDDDEDDAETEMPSLKVSSIAKVYKLLWYWLCYK